jgi:hypothetical protein
LETEVAPKSAKPRRSKQPDYIAAIAANAIILIIVNEVLNWGILPFLTQDFKQVIPIQNISLAATIVFNAAFLFYDPDWFTSLLKMVLNGVGVAVVLRYMSVFPFDFSAYSGFNWTVLARVMLVIGLVGCSIAIIVEAAKFVGALIDRK